MPNVTINSNLNALEPTTGTEFTQQVASAGTPERLTATATYFRMAILMAKKTAQTINTDKIYWGPGSAAGAQSYEMSPGDVVFLTMPTGCRANFYELWIDAAANDDGLTIIYW